MTLLGGTSVLLFVLAGSGTNAATPPLGPAPTVGPFGLSLSSAAVSVVLVAAYLLGAATVLIGLRSVSRGWRPEPRRVALAAVLAVGALVLVAPFGSADHLSYAAYGRIAAQGGDPYVIAPSAWHGGTDPIASAARPPWQNTPSVYGPVATAIQAATSLIGGTSVRVTVLAWQLVVAACFLATGWLLHRLTRVDPARAARAAVIWSLNPLLLGTLVGGAHLDAVSAAAATLCLVVAGRRRDSPSLRGFALDVVAGAAWGVAAGTKLPYAAVGVAVLWGLRRASGRELARTLVAATLGAAAVLVPAYWWAGPHVFAVVDVAARWVSLGTAWRGAVNLVTLLTGSGDRTLLPVAFALLAVLVLVAVLALLGAARATRTASPDAPSLGPNAEGAVLALLALGTAYLLAAPYVLPWYDALVWPALAAATTTVLDGPLVLRLTALAIGYVPGRVEDVSSTVWTVGIDVRTYVVPVVTGGVLAWVLVRGWRELRSRRSSQPA